MEMGWTLFDLPVYDRVRSDSASVDMLTRRYAMHRLRLLLICFGIEDAYASYAG